MSDDKKILVKNITQHPDGADISFWCDYIELRCLTHKDKRFSRSDLIDLLCENKDLARGSEFDDENTDTTASEKSDRHEEKVSNFFRALKSRQQLFEAAWPFLLDEGLKELALNKKLKDWSAANYLYVQFLLSSMLAYIEKTRAPELTTSFEHISHEVFRALMPQHSEIHAFGANNSARYQGKLYDRLLQLAQDFRGRLITPENKFPKQGSGDWNIDLVAWHPMGDARSHIPLALAQCGCSTTDWRTKMGDVSSSAKGAHLATSTDWSTYYFLPEDFAQLEGDVEDWPDYKYGYFHRAIVIDRLRALRLSGQYQILEKLPIGSGLVEEAYQLEFV